MVKICLIDDDQNILASLSLALKSEKFDVETYSDGIAGLEALKDNNFDIAILDIKMPRLDGLEVLQKLRNSSDIPVIFLTSKDDEIDQLLGLKMGADDYITKPFSQKLLIERVKVILKRTSFSSIENTVNSDSFIERGNLILNMDRHECHWKEERIKLTVTEFLLLESLVNRPGYVKNRDQLMSAAYSDDLYVDDRTIDSHIKRIRRKFKAIDKDFNSIETLYGVGYRFNQ
ncbi:response regulator transcription factor [OCS116 cluster bacterium]|nr:response regulator transcription factor [OCS116 cluster bacterium]